MLKTGASLALLVIIVADLVRHPPRLTPGGQAVLACFAFGLFLLILGLWRSAPRANPWLEPIPFAGLGLMMAASLLSSFAGPLASPTAPVRYTAAQKTRIKQATAIARRRQYIVIVAFSLALAAIYMIRTDPGRFSFGVPANVAVAVLVVFVLVPGVIFSFKNRRCPGCGGLVRMGFKVCGHCGAELR